VSRVSELQLTLGTDQAFYVSDPLNIRYLCGFSGSFGALFITASEAILLTDSRYLIQAQSETSDVDINASGSLYPSTDLLGRCNELLFEKSHLTIDRHERLSNAAKTAKLTGTTSTIESMRIVKDNAEVSHIRTACSIATQALAHIMPAIHVGMSEREVARLLESTMLDFGADGVAFDTIVATGAHSAIPHHQPTEQILTQGDLLKIDFGAKVNGYHSDCTRTFVMGKALAWQRDVYAQVLTAQETGRKSIEIGKTFAAVNEAARASITNPDYAATFQHGLGHGVGLAIHEDPFFSASQQAKIETGMVFTVEPGIYLAERGGVRIEDTLLITPQGYENLTEFSYDLISLG
jgi:Xaa-Pro aminopeptidase